MRLKKVHIRQFRSVEDSEEFDVSDSTCLVGKNEAGKSAILMALAALNPHESTPVILDKERDYPRRYLTQYKQRHPDGDALAVRTILELEAEELQDLANRVGPGTVRSAEVVAFRRYQSSLSFTFSVDYKAAIKHLFDLHKLDAADRKLLLSASTTSELIELLEGIAEPSDNITALSAYLKKYGTITHQVTLIIKDYLPKFMYFSSYDRMDGAIQLERTKKLIANETINNDEFRGQKLFAEFLKYAGVEIDELMAVETYETFNAKLKAASNNITDQVLEYWTQNPDLTVDVRVEQAKPGDPEPFNSGTIARARIDNHLHRVDTPFSERSAGFVWFFSFLVKFAQVKDDGQPVVLLLDEPGLTLHGTAQADLLRFFKEKLVPFHQILYSTHSPFMVPHDDLASVRIVQDEVETKGARRLPIGTKVKDDVLTRDPDTLFPLQGALGYNISQSLFVGKNTLLVEGPGDILYLQALSDALRRNGGQGLDARWTLCPAGGIDHIKPFVSLFSGKSLSSENRLNVAALSDQTYGDRKKIENMKKSDVLKAGYFYTVADFLKRSEADIEDVFSASIFVNILNNCYNLADPYKLTAAKLKAADTTTERQIKQAEAAFKVMPDTIPMLDHFAPAAWLLRNPKVLDAKNAAVTETLERAQKICDAFNRLL